MFTCEEKQQALYHTDDIIEALSKKLLHTGRITTADECTHHVDVETLTISDLTDYFIFNKAEKVDWYRKGISFVTEDGEHDVQFDTDVNNMWEQAAYELVQERCSDNLGKWS